MGCEQGRDEEKPVHRVWVDEFQMAVCQVRNRDYACFLESSGNPAPLQWNDPHLNHPGQPVVSVSWFDALAYCEWLSRMCGRPYRLPAEAEWERAARGGLESAEFAWGDELFPNGEYRANTWQGEFPIENSADDGFEGTAPVGSFPPNGFGIYDMIGNTWEWTRDWYTARHRAGDTCCAAIRNPRGGTQDESYDPRTPDVRIPRKVMKGGSFLCAPNYCRRYRPAARMAQSIDTSTSHLGFRCVVRTAPRI
jgi:formylglycine-generating enzyme required for sulfatase activity